MSYRLKKIHFFGRWCSILCQNENGPCPLIAISNILLLQGRISIHPDIAEIFLNDLIQIVANKLLESDNTACTEYDRLMKQQQTDNVIDLLPRLQYGLDVNVKFSGVQNFEFTEELAAFDIFGINIYHGWIVDPEESEMVKAVNDLSYNLLINRIVEYHNLKDQLTKKEEEESKSTISLPSIPSDNITDNVIIINDIQEIIETKEEKEEEITDNNHDDTTSMSSSDITCLREGKILEEFLTNTASQLTFSGLVALHETMREKELAVLFRNNHFGTIFCHNKSLFLLVTDLGYANENTIVWELLDDIQGDTEYVDDSFRRHLPNITPTITTTITTSTGNNNNRSSSYHPTTAALSPSSALNPSQQQQQQQQPYPLPLIESKQSFDSNLDPDFLLALQLQEQESHPTESFPISSSQSTLLNSSHLTLLQEEEDHRRAMELQNEENNANIPPTTATTAASIYPVDSHHHQSQLPLPSPSIDIGLGDRFSESQLALLRREEELYFKEKERLASAGISTTNSRDHQQRRSQQQQQQQSQYDVPYDDNNNHNSNVNKNQRRHSKSKSTCCLS